MHPAHNAEPTTQTGGLWGPIAPTSATRACPPSPATGSRSTTRPVVDLGAQPSYYPVVTKDGQELPFIDKIRITAVADAEVGKIQIAVGKVAYTHRPFNGR